MRSRATRSTHSSRNSITGLSSALVALALCCCVSVPGDTREERRAHIDAFAEETLELLVEQSPEAGELLDGAAGYLVVRQKVAKVPVFGAGGGWGVIVDHASGERTYVKARRVDIGAGWGARVTRVILILRTPDALADALDGDIEFGIGAEAGAKAGDAGGGASGAARPEGAEAVSYVLLETGASATVTAYAVRTSPMAALN